MLSMVKSTRLIRGGGVLPLAWRATASDRDAACQHYGPIRLRRKRCEILDGVAVLYEIHVTSRQRFTASDVPCYYLQRAFVPELIIPSTQASVKHRPRSHASNTEFEYLRFHTSQHDEHLFIGLYRCYSLSDEPTAYDEPAGSWVLRPPPTCQSRSVCTPSRLQ